MDAIHGMKIRWTFTDGPMAGKQYEHQFARDGTVTYGVVGGPPSAPVKYEAVQINKRVQAVSYLGNGGYTLTCVLDLDANTLVAFASNERELMVQRGTFELVDEIVEQAPPPLH